VALSFVSDWRAVTYVKLCHYRTEISLLPASLDICKAPPAIDWLNLCQRLPR
jgi:hypothetical protein